MGLTIMGLKNDIIRKNSKITRRLLVTALITMSMVFLMSFSVSAEEPEFINAQLISTIDFVDWAYIEGSLDTGFTMELDSAIDFYYLDFKYADTNTLLKEGFYGFNITQNPSGFFDYWNDKGVNEEATNGTWQQHAWNIINGYDPTFYIHVDANQNLALIDGLQRDFAGDDTAPLMVNGDYPRGMYSYIGNISSVDDDLSQIEIVISFVDKIDILDRPNLLEFDLELSNDQIEWDNTYGSLMAGYSVSLNSSESTYFFRTEESSSYLDLAEGFYGFYQISAPGDYISYWAGLGVDASSPVGTWQAQMWKIINGDAPMFYISVDSSQTVEIIDGLLKDHYGVSDAQFRINADIPVGLYIFEGVVTSENGINSEPVEFFFRCLDEASATVWVDDSYDSGTPGWGTTHFATISDGINASVDGGIVNVQPGTYREVFSIDKPIVLRSTWGSLSSRISDEDATYTQLVNTGGHTVQIASNHVFIEGFTIDRFGSVVRTSAIGNNDAWGIDHIEIRDCDFDSTIDTVWLTDVTSLCLRSNTYTCQYDDNAIVLTNVTDTVFQNNEVRTYNRYGLLGYNVSKLFVDNNEFSYKRLDGLFVDAGDTIIVTDSSFTDSERNGIFINDSIDVAIIDCLFEETVVGIGFGDNVIAYLFDNSLINNQRNIDRAARIGDGLIHYSQIQTALNVASVTDIINLYPGIYPENIIINHTVKISGLEDASDTIISGSNESSTVLIGGNDVIRNVEISGISITGGNHSLRTGRYVDVSGLEVKDCIIYDPEIGYAVYIDPHNYTDASSSRNGTYIFPSAVVFTNNHIRGHFEYQYWPFEVYYATINRQLDITNNDIDSLFLNGSISVRIRGNKLHTLGLTYSRDILIHNNHLENPWEERYGIYLWSINGTPPVSTVQISHNTIIGYSSFAVTKGISGQGIVVAGAQVVTITGNNIQACTDGIWVKQEYINQFDQLCIGFVHDLDVINNDIKICQAGIKLHSEIVHAYINRNSFSLNGNGVWVHGSDGHLITNNTFTDNYKGIQFDSGSDFNLVYNNYFSNTVNVYDQFSETNQYNVSAREGINILGGPYIGGNFWNDYDGEDTDGDSLGDTQLPYNGSGSIKHMADYLPIILTDVTPPVVNLIYPNGGETLNGTVTILWEAYDDFDPNPVIDIEYSDDSGETWYMISPNEENVGEYNWDTSTLPEGNQYLIRITAKDTAGHRSNDTSDAEFTIYRDIPGPSIEITKPLLGYLYFHNAQKARFLSNSCFIFGNIVIEATVETDLQVEKVEFYINNQLVNTSVGSQSVHSWRWAEPVLFFHEIQVKAYDIRGNTGEDEIGVTMFNFGIIP